MAKKQVTIDDIVKLTALFWGEYCRCVQLPVQPACYDKMVELGIVANVIDSRTELGKFGKLFDEAMDCCGRAGARSLQHAQKQKMLSITPEVFERAFRQTSTAVKRARAAAGKEGLGPLC